MVGDQLLNQDIRRAIDAELAKKGLAKTEEAPNLFVAYQASVDKQKQ
jgi:hypothetical protein